MSRTTYTPSLPGLTADDNLDTIINWGAGADSTAHISSPPRTPTGSTSIALPSSTWPPAASGPKPGSWPTSS